MTLSALGIFSAAGAGGAAASSFQLISTTILTGSQAFVSLDVSSFASTYRHLQIRYTAKSDRSSGDGNDAMIMRLNGDSGSNYNSHVLGGDGSSVFSGYESGNLTSMDYTFIAGTGGNISGGYGFGVIDFLDAYSTTKFKTRRALWGNGLGGSYRTVGLSSGLWRNTNAISTITFLPRYGTNLVAGSRFSVYGITG